MNGKRSEYKPAKSEKWWSLRHELERGTISIDGVIKQSRFFKWMKEEGINFENYINFERLSEDCEYDLSLMSKKLKKIAKKIPKTTTINYGTGRLWYLFHEFRRKID